MKEYQNYIFDLYGTLADIKTDEKSLSFWKKINSYIEEHRGISCNDAKMRQRFYLDAVEKEESKMGLFNAEIDLRYVFAEMLFYKRNEYQCREIQSFANFFRKESLVYLKLYENTLSTLKQLKKQGKKIYLLSNAQSCFTMRELKSLKLESVFDGIYISSDYGVKKPNPLFLKILMEKEKLALDETVLIGNEFQSDIACAIGYGIDSIYLNTGGHTEYDYVKMIKKMRKECLEHTMLDMQSVYFYHPYVIDSGDIKELLTSTNLKIIF